MGVRGSERRKKMRNGPRGLLAWLNLYVGTEISVATFDTNHSVAPSVLQLTGSVVKPVVTARHGQSMCQAKPSGCPSVCGYPLIAYI